MAMESMETKWHWKQWKEKLILTRNYLKFLNFLCIIFHDNNDAIVICFVSFTSLFNKFLIQIFVYFWWSSRSLALIINFPTDWCISFHISWRSFVIFPQEKCISNKKKPFFCCHIVYVKLWNNVIDRLLVFSFEMNKKFRINYKKLYDFVLE